MVNTELRAAGCRPTSRDTKRSRKLPLLDRLGRLPEDEVREAIGLLCRGSADANYRKFMTLRERLEKRGVHINLGRGMNEHSSVGMGVSIFCEFTTSRSALDATLRSEVEEMGFDLMVSSRPVFELIPSLVWGQPAGESVKYELKRTARIKNKEGVEELVNYYEPMQERTYRVMASSLTSNVSNVIETAEKLVELTDMLQGMGVPLTSVCDNVVELPRTIAPEPPKSGIRVVQDAVKEAAEA